MIFDCTVSSASFNLKLCQAPATNLEMYLVPAEKNLAMSGNGRLPAHSAGTKRKNTLAALKQVSSVASYSRVSANPSQYMSAWRALTPQWSESVSLVVCWPVSAWCMCDLK